MQQPKIGLEGRCCWKSQEPRIYWQLLLKLEARKKGTVEPKGRRFSVLDQKVNIRKKIKPW